MSESGQRRFYRESFSASDLKYFRVGVDQSDLFIGADENLYDLAEKALIKAREEIKNEITKRPAFLTSYFPLLYTGGSSELIRKMYAASDRCNVGPMAAVAGAVSEYVGNGLLTYSENVIVENGGDLFISTKSKRTVAIYAGQSSLSGKIAVEIQPGKWGVCTSAYSVGHSYSEGRCDAAVVLSHDTALADAAATALGNSIKNEHQLERGVKNIMNIDGVLGTLAVINEKVAAAGEIVIKPIQGVQI